METALSTDGCKNTDIACCNGFCDEGVRWSASKQQPIISLNGVEKDTVIVPPGDYVVIRFESDNPGWWFLHCHIEPHQLEGMAMVIDESNGIPAAPANFPRCNNYSTSSTPSTTSPTVIGLSVELVHVIFAILMFILVICCIILFS